MVDERMPPACAFMTVACKKRARRFEDSPRSPPPYARACHVCVDYDHHHVAERRARRMARRRVPLRVKVTIDVDR